MKATRGFLIVALAVGLAAPALAQQQGSVYIGIGYGDAAGLDGFEDHAQVFRVSYATEQGELGYVQGRFGLRRPTAGLSDANADYQVFFLSQDKAAARHWRTSYGVGYAYEKVKGSDELTGARIVSKSESWTISAGAKYARDVYMLAFEYHYFLGNAAADGLMTLTLNFSFDSLGR